MGGMISLLEAAAAPESVAGLVLIDPALPFVPARPDPGVTALFAAYATPGLNRILMARRARMTPEQAVLATLRLCCVDVSRIPPGVVAQHVRLAERRTEFTDVSRDFVRSARSVVATAGYVNGAPYRRGIRSLDAPVLLVHGAKDRLVPVAAARVAARVNPSWTTVIMPDVGHVPQLEAAPETAATVLTWLDGPGRDAAKAASR